MKKYIAIIILLIAFTAYAFPPTPPTVNITGNAATATALASNPTDCAANAVATAIDASGNLTCGYALNADIQAYDADLDTWAGITPSTDVQTMLGSANATAIRSNIGLGTIATQNADAVSITGGNATGLTNLGAANATITGDIISSTGDLIISTSGKGLDLSANTGAVNAKANATITSNGTNVSDGDTVTIDTTTYTFKTTLTPSEGQVLIGATAAESLDNLKLAVNRTDPGTNDGVKYKCAAAHATVEATTNTDTVQTLEALTAGVAGNQIALAEVAATLTASSATLRNGTTVTISSEKFTVFESGTWTPDIKFGGSNVGMTYSKRLGSYIRIGNWVMARAYMILTAKGSSTGNASVDGLPYPCVANAVIPVSVYLLTVTYANQFEAMLSSSNNYVQLQEITEAGLVGNMTNADFADASRVSIVAIYNIE